MKLSNNLTKRKDVLLDELRDKKNDLETAIHDFNAALAELRTPVEDAIAAYNEQLAIVKEFTEEVAEHISEYISEKTDSWQESEKGEAEDDLLSTWEQIDLDDFELDLPEDLDESLPTHDDDLEELPTETE